MDFLTVLFLLLVTVSVSRSILPNDPFPFQVDPAEQDRVCFYVIFLSQNVHVY